MSDLEKGDCFGCRGTGEMFGSFPCDACDGTGQLPKDLRSRIQELRDRLCEPPMGDPIFDRVNGSAFWAGVEFVVEALDEILGTDPEDGS